MNTKYFLAAGAVITTLALGACGVSRSSTKLYGYPSHHFQDLKDL